jgi:hypothetical protein
MDNKQTEKIPMTGSKSFLSIGPTLHYSHENVQIFWLFALIIFGATCAFWNKLTTGGYLSFDLNTFFDVTSFSAWQLGKCVISGISIYEFAWQILVLGLLMALLAFIPVVISQLLSFTHSLLFILCVAFIANLPGFAISLLLSCFAVACRPLRFRSRFIAIVLCTTPQLFYWGYFGGVRGLEPLKFGFSFAPWLCAWLLGLCIVGLILSIGHFTRYRPGSMWVITALVLFGALSIFENRIGFDELDYQFYVAKNNPEQMEEFQEHSITKPLDDTMLNPKVQKYLSDFFYSADKTALRLELKEEIQREVTRNSWPVWFDLPAELKYEEKRNLLFSQYDLFINVRVKSNRMPIALYYKALLSELSPDLNLLWEKEILKFYNSYPFERSRSIWYKLYSEFPQSPESAEARWRIAMFWASQNKFEQADTILAEAQKMLNERMKTLEQEQPQADSLFSPFKSPAYSTMNSFKIIELQRRINMLRSLINSQNRNTPETAERLAKFVGINPHSTDYPQKLENLLAKTPASDPLRDNLLLAQIQLIADDHLRAEKLSQLHKDYPNTDGGIQALYEYSAVKINFWLQQSESDLEQKKKLLVDTRLALTTFLNLYPNSIFVEQVKKYLDRLPSAE